MNYITKKEIFSRYSSIHLADMADDLARDIMETMLEPEDNREADTQEYLMARLEDGAGTEALINHDFTLDLPNSPALSEGPVNFDGNLESGEQQYFQAGV